MMTHFIARIRIYGKYKAERYKERTGEFPWDTVRRLGYIP